MGGLASPTHPRSPSFSRQNKDNHARGGSIWLLAILQRANYSRAWTLLGNANSTSLFSSACEII